MRESRTHLLKRRAKLVPKLVGLVAGQSVRRSARRLGIARPGSVDPGVYEPPDTELCLRATDLARELSSPSLFHHCVRTWAFGAVLGDKFGHDFDRELFYVAALLHDLGLTPKHAGDDWFERRGAKAAFDFCLDAGMARGRAEMVREAIALHDQLEAAEREPEIALVHFGAGLDVIGYHAEDVADGDRDAIVARWPRLGFKREILELLGGEVERVPSCPIADQWAFGFADRIRTAPFAE